jgi:release factor glutamine methyltransferase
MVPIKKFKNKYLQKISPLDLEILFSFVLNKSREFILTHPEHKLSHYQALRIKYYIWQRVNNKPIAYITGHKEFYGLDFKVNKNTLIPRPETEQIVDLVLNFIKARDYKSNTIIDIGTGSGNIIISTAKELQNTCFAGRLNTNYYATDISKKALKTAKNNAKKHGVDKKIKFLHGSLLKPIFNNLKIKNSRIIILANLPYLSDEIYGSAPKDVIEFEPKSALYSDNYGLAHYEKLFKQIKDSVFFNSQFITLLEISPEQKDKIDTLAKKYFPEASIEFKKDLAGKWRVCQVNS